VKTATTAQVTMVPAFLVRAIALLAFRPEAGEFDTAEAEDVEDVPDEEVLDLAGTEGGGAGGGMVTELDVATAGVQDGADESELGAGSVGDGDGVDVAGAC